MAKVESGKTPEKTLPIVPNRIAPPTSLRNPATRVYVFTDQPTQGLQTTQNTQNKLAEPDVGDENLMSERGEEFKW